MNGLIHAVREFFGWTVTGHRPAASAAPAAAEAARVGLLMAECRRLRDRAHGAGVALDNSPVSLAALDRLIGIWRAHPNVPTWLPIEIGGYLGTVMTHSVPGARWHLRADGHPLIRLESGREVDVLARGSDAVVRGTALVAIYDRARVG
jgi:hypothetical protein